MTVRVIKLFSVSQKWYANTLDMKMFEKQFAAQHTNNPLKKGEECLSWTVMAEYIVGFSSLN